MYLWRGFFNKTISTRRRWHKLKIYAAADLKGWRPMPPTWPFRPVLTPKTGPGAFPSSRLDSHRNFEPFWLGYVDFRPFPTRFVQFFDVSLQDHAVMWCDVMWCDVIWSDLIWAGAKREKGKSRPRLFDLDLTRHSHRAHARTHDTKRFPGWTHPPNLRCVKKMVHRRLFKCMGLSILSLKSLFI